MTDLGFRMRRARKKDVFDVHRIHTTSIREECSSHYPPEILEVWVDAFNPDNFPENIHRMEFFVAELADASLGGFLALDLPARELESIYVAPWALGRGLGSFLLGFAEELARKNGLQDLWLDSSLNAVSFYAGFGWHQVQRHARVRRGVEIPVVKMEKSLTS